MEEPAAAEAVVTARAPLGSQCDRGGGRQQEGQPFPLLCEGDCFTPVCTPCARVGHLSHLLGAPHPCGLPPPHPCAFCVLCTSNYSSCPCLVQCIIMVFPDEFHLGTLEALLGALPELQPGVRVHAIMAALLDRLARCEGAGPAACLPAWVCVCVCGWVGGWSACMSTCRSDTCDRCCQHSEPGGRS